MDGYVVRDASRGVIVPHAFHLYPTILAIAHSLGGLSASLWTTPIIAMLGLVGFFLLARRLFGNAVAMVASILLVANPAIIWFARYPVAESLVFLWIASGLLALVLACDRENRHLALLAGLLLGAAHLTKVEIIMLPVALGCFLYFQWLTFRLRSIHWYFLVAYGLMVVHAVLHAYCIAYEYTFFHFNVVFAPNGNVRRFVVAGVLAVIVLVSVIIGRRWIAAMVTSPVWKRFASGGVVAGLLLVAGYAYYLRPRLGGPVTIPSVTDIAAAYEFMNRSSFVILGWYVSPIGLLLGVIGYTIALVRAGSARTAVLLMLAVFDAVWLLNEGRIRPLHFWATRRYVPVVFPAIALFSAYALWRVQRALRGHWPESVLPAVLGFVMLAACLGGWLPFRSHVEYRGAVAQFGDLAAHFPEQSIVFFDESDSGRRLSTPLQYIYERSSFILWQRTVEDGSAARLLDEALAHGRDVYWVRSGSPLDVAKWGYSQELVATPVIDLPEVLASVDHRPNEIGRFRVELQVYHILPKS